MREEVFAIEPGLPDLVQRADRLGLPGDCHRRASFRLTLATDGYEG